MTHISETFKIHVFSTLIYLFVLVLSMISVVSSQSYEQNDNNTLDENTRHIADKMVSIAEERILDYKYYDPLKNRGTTVDLEKLKLAEDACNKVINKYPGTQYAAEMTYEIFGLYRLRRDYSKCRDVLNSIIKNYPQSKYSYNSMLALAIIEKEEGQTDKAISILELIPLSSETHYGAQLEIAECLILSGKVESARKLISNTENIYPNNIRFIRERFARLPSSVLGNSDKAFYFAGRYSSIVCMTAALQSTKDPSIFDEINACIDKLELIEKRDSAPWKESRRLKLDLWLTAIDKIDKCMILSEAKGDAPLTDVQKRSRVAITDKLKEYDTVWPKNMLDYVRAYYSKNELSGQEISNMIKSKISNNVRSNQLIKMLAEYLKAID
jgi:tetratricopeptide (TPR) repeat protein